MSAPIALGAPEPVELALLTLSPELYDDFNWDDVLGNVLPKLYNWCVSLDRNMAFKLYFTSRDYFCAYINNNRNIKYDDIFNVAASLFLAAKEMGLLYFDAAFLFLDHKKRSVRAKST